MAEEQTPRAPAPHRTWRAATSSRSTTTAAPRWRGILLFSLLLAAIAGAVVAFFFFIKQPPAPHFLALTFSEYHSDIVPYNAFADQDGKALRDCLGGKDTFTRQERQLFVNEISNLQRRTDETVVVYLRAYAVARKHHVFILPAEEDEAAWYPLTEVLQALGRCSAKNKLLILDLMRPVADARLGVLADNVAAEVAKLLQNHSDTNLQILTACSPGQVSLLAPGFQQSAFAYYLKQGLSGAADGYNPNGERDKTISVAELVHFVNARVERYAIDRNARQTPALYGTQKDFALTTYDELPQTPSCELAAVFDEGEWKRLDAWRESEKGRKPSDDLRRLQAELLRAEQHRAGGKKTRAALDGFNVPATPSTTSTKAANSTAAPAPDKNGTPPAKPPDVPGANFREKLKRALEKMQVSDQAVEVKDDKSKPGGETKPDKDVEDAATEGKKKLEADRDGFAQDLVTVMALEPRANPMVLKWLADMVDSWPGQPPRGVQLLRDLTRPPSVLLRLDNKNWKGQAAAKAVQRAFESVRRADEVDAHDEDTRRWIQADVSAARAKFEEGIALLSKRAGDGNARSNAANVLEEAKVTYERALNIADAVVKAQRTCNEALVFLPEYAPYLISQDSQIKAWGDAVDVCAKLTGLLATPQQATNQATELRESANALRNLIEPLREDFANHVKRVLQESRPEHAAADPSRCEQLRAILRTPIPSASVRKELWQALEREEERLHQKTATKDQEDSQIGRITAAMSESSRDALDGARREIELAALRGQVAIGLLKLRGAKEMQFTDSQGERITVTVAQLSNELSEAIEDARRRVDPSAFDDVAVRLGRCLKARRSPD